MPGALQHFCAKGAESKSKYLSDYMKAHPTLKEVYQNNKKTIELNRNALIYKIFHYLLNFGYTNQFLQCHCLSCSAHFTIGKLEELFAMHVL